MVSSNKAPNLRDWTRFIRHMIVIAFLHLCWVISFLCTESLWLRVGALSGELLGRLHARSESLRIRLADLKLDQTTMERDLWRDLGVRVFEAVRLRRTSLRFELSPQAEELFESLRSRKEGTLILCSHFGHWEAMGVALNRFGFQYSAVSTQGKRDLVNRFIQSRRQSMGVCVIDGPDSARLIVNELRESKPVALFVDVPAKRRGVQINFLRRTVNRSTVINRLAKLNPCPTIFVFNQRDERGVYRIYAEEIPDDVDLIKWSHVRLESLILAAPSQWVWLLE